jgi:hypothetical protein
MMDIGMLDPKAMFIEILAAIHSLRLPSFVIPGRCAASNPESN